MPLYQPVRAARASHRLAFRGMQGGRFASGREAARRRVLSAGLAVSLSLGLMIQCRGGEGPYPSIREIPRQPPQRGSLVLTARLAEKPERFPANEYYDYACVMKYTVEFVYQGDYQGETIYVAHYNPRLPRMKAGQGGLPVGGNLQAFRVGDLHYLVLDSMDRIWQDALEDEFFRRPGRRYWALWADLYEPADQSVRSAATGDPAGGKGTGQVSVPAGR